MSAIWGVIDFSGKSIEETIRIACAVGDHRVYIGGNVCRCIQPLDNEHLYQSPSHILCTLYHMGCQRDYRYVGDFHHCGALHRYG